MAMYSAAETTVRIRLPQTAGPGGVSFAPGPPRPSLPTLAPGLQLLGRYEGSGFRDDHFLVARADGQVVHLSALLYHVLAELAPDRTADDVARAVSARVGKVLPPDGVRFLLEKKLAPGGLLDVGPEVHVPGTQVGAPTAELPVPQAGSARKADPLLALRLHKVLLTARATGRVAGALRFLFAPVAVALLLSALLVVDGLLITGGATQIDLLPVITEPVLMLAVLGMLFGGTLFHEFGHAAGCRYGGGNPGAIGVGVYVILPAFYTNVTDAYRLDRAGRLRTDLGGIYFNSIAALAFGVAFLSTGWVPFLLAAFLMHLEALQQCLPLIRSDGYFILADLVGVPDLFGRIRPVLASLLPWRTAGPRVRELRPRVRVVISAWVLVVVPVLGAAMVYLVLQTPTIVGSGVASVLSQWGVLIESVGSGSWATAVLTVFSILLLVLPLAGLSVFLVRLVGQLGVLMVHRARAWRARAESYGRHHDVTGRKI
jgi:putative peptide zinc metalloprotease protein